MVVQRAKEKAEAFGIPIVCTLEEMLANQEINIILNLTMPGVHADICLQALNADKHIYVEKPLATTREDGKKFLRLPMQRGF